MATERPSQVKVLLVIVALLVGVIIGMVAGVLVVADGGSMGAAFGTGGGALAVAVTLVLLIEKSLGLI